MRKTASNSLFLLLFLLISNLIYSQQGNVIVRQNPVIDSLMVMKVDNDRSNYESQYITIQIFYGNYVKAQEQINRFKLKFPEVEVDLSFETPNYKVQAGKYKEALKAAQELDKIKEVFPSAFLLTKK